MNELLDILGLGGLSQSSAVVNLAEDLAKLTPFVAWISMAAGIILLAMATFDFVNKDSPNSNVTASGASIFRKAFFGTMLLQMKFWYTEVTDSLWEGASPALPMGYVELARTAEGNNSAWATFFGALAILTLFAYVWGAIALWKFANLDRVQDKHGEAGKAFWMMVGSTIILNLVPFARDVIGSLGGDPMAIKSVI